MSFSAIQASAGTGKTFEVCQRVLEQVAGGRLLTRIVVVSFTEAASADLRRRVRERLRDAYDGLLAKRDGSTWKPPDEVLEAWRETASLAALPLLARAIADFDEAPISTVHGLCSRILRTHAFEVGTPFELEIGASRDLQEQLADDVLRRLTAEVDPAWLGALPHLGLDQDSLRGLAGEALELELELRPQACVPRDPPDLDAWDVAVDTAQQLWAQHGATFCDDVVDCTNLRSATGGQLGTLRRWIEDPGLNADIPGDVACVRAKVGTQLPQHATLLDAIDALVAEHAASSGPLQAWGTYVRWKLVRDVRTHAEAARRRSPQVSFDDLVRAVRDASVDPDRGPALRDELTERFELVLVDEAQDNDDVQWTLLRELFGDRLTVVGDPKQSIYAFRRANVHAWFAAVGEDFDTLDRNFRSDERLLAAVNHLFATGEQPFAGAPDGFDPTKPRHKKVRTSSQEPPLELVYLPIDDAPQWQGRPNKLARQKCATRVAEEIAQVLDSDLQVEGRRVLASDCAVLTRTNDEATWVRNALAERGVPSAFRSKDAVTKNAKLVADVVAVLEAFAHPADRNRVSRALATDLVGCSAGKIVSFREGDAWTRIVARCRHWGEVWRQRGVLAALLGWMEDRDALVRILERPGGARRATDLRHVAELLQHAEADQRLSPEGLVAWLRLGARGVEDELARQRVSTDEHAVQITTLHSAKGLEYGLVWLPYAWRSTWSSGARYYDRAAQQWVLDVEVGSASEDGKLDNLQEDLRVLYVGLTRAKHRCVVYWLPPQEEGALGYLLHRGDGEDIAALRKVARRRSRRAADVETDLATWASHPDIAVRTASLWADPGHTRVDLRVEGLDLRPLARSTGLDLVWRRGSFSSLMRDEQGWRAGDEPPPESDRGDEPELPEEDAGGKLVPLADFPSGSKAGNFLHDLLEHHDFGASAELRGRVRTALTEHGFDAEQWTKPVTDAIDDALHTPLWPDEATALADLPRAATLRELDVALPTCGGYAASGGVTVDALADVFDQPLGPGAPAATAQRIRRLSFKKLRGFLVGQIDLVFQHEGRFYVLDWKSNRLGKHVDAYDQASMASAMLEAGYVLQYHLYVLFLHRFLRQRMGRDTYDYDQHVGGVAYAFLRGMQRATGPHRGVFRDRPPKQLIDALDALFRGNP